MAVNVINPNKGRVYLSKEGLQLDSANLDKYHPNSNVNTLQVNIEDGGVLNTMAMINYQTPSMAVQSQAITSHWYPLFFIGINNVKVANEGGRRTFAQFLTPIPVNILNLNLGRSTPMNVKATVKLVGGVNFKGVFDSLGELQAQIPPTLELDEEYAIACVIDELGNVDYYQVDETSTDIYEWVKNSETTNPILSLLESKQYNIFNISVQGGFGNATPLPLATQHYQILWQAINNQGNAISDLDNKVDNVLSFYQNLIQSVGETPTVKPTITNDFPNGKRLELDVKVSDNNDLIEVESDGLKVTNAKVDERIDLKTNPIIQELDEHIEDLDNPHGVTAEQVDTYNKSTIDNKDANTLQEAKDYTYSKVEIDNKDTAIMNKANNLENANMFKDVNYNNVNGVLTFTKYDDTTKQIDLPLELIVTSGYYDEVANELVLVLANGSEIRIPVDNLLTDLDAHNIRFNGSGTNYLVSKTDVESAVKELDTRVKNVNDTKADKTYVDAQDQILDNRIDTIIAGTVEGVSGAEIVDARQGEATLGANISKKVFGKQGTITGNIGGNARGINSTDFQFERVSNKQVASSKNSFIAGGQNNEIGNVLERDTNAENSLVYGIGNRALDWFSFVGGAGSISDGKISVAIGNAVICSANDSFAEGNRTVAGRKYFTNIIEGVEDAGDGLGSLNYILVDDTVGDISSYFPNALTDNVTTRYGTGAQKDEKGNIYPQGMTPAVWSGNTLVTSNDLKWALHPFAIVRGTGETNIDFVNIAKTVYESGVGTKIYYYGIKKYPTVIGIYTSYAPTVSINGLLAGNGTHAEGYFTSAVGTGAHAEGVNTEAWNYGAHAEGSKTRAYGRNSHAEGQETEATGLVSHAEGYQTKATGDYSHAQGIETEATGFASHAEGYQTKATGDYSHVEGRENEANGLYSTVKGYRNKATAQNSHAQGQDAYATRKDQRAVSNGRRLVLGDNQVSNIMYSKNLSNTGWFGLIIFSNLENGKSYYFESVIMGRQVGGSAETIGNTFVYKASGVVIKESDNYIVPFSPTVELVGRSSGMSGDGITTGVRVNWVSNYTDIVKLGGDTQNSIFLRYDGVLNTTFYVTTNNKVQEIG